jgi:hypothetical protein
MWDDEREALSSNGKQCSIYSSRFDVFVKSYFSLFDHLGTLYSRSACMFQPAKFAPVESLA